jgi:hypothetical protein
LKNVLSYFFGNGNATGFGHGKDNC